MKLNTSPRVTDRDSGRELKDHALQVNLMAEGRMVAYYTAQTAAPTTGKHAQGDFLLNSGAAELGSVGSKYVIHGWQCVLGGEPGTWVQMRYLTGN